MERINVSQPVDDFSISSSVSNDDLKKQVDKAFVTQLEAHHYPDEAERGNISGLLEKLCQTDSVDELLCVSTSVISELKIMQDDIYNMRKHVFNIVNVNTAQVYGVLNDNFTIHDRDQYIKKLINYYEACKKIKGITETNPIRTSNIYITRLGGHHSSSLWGDMLALECLMSGGKANVPDLTYNMGEYQFG